MLSVTWPTDDPGAQQPATPQPYQGSYPTSPFDDHHGLGTPPRQPLSYGQPTVYGQAAQYGQPDPYGQESQGGYGGYGQPAALGGPGGSGPARGGRTGLLVGLAAAGLVLVVAVVAVVLYLRDGRSDPVANTEPNPSTSTTPSGPPASTSRPPLTSSQVARPEPVVPGWQVAVSGKRKLAYDVPPGWKIVPDEQIVGFEDAAGEPQVGMSGAALYQDGYCSEADASWRGGTGFTGYRDNDLALVATDAAGKWARFGYLGPNGEEPVVSVGAASDFTVNGVDGAYAKATVQITAPAPCAPPTAVVHTFALPAAEGSYVFIVVADQGVPDALTDDLATQIIRTIRPAG